MNKLIAPFIVMAFISAPVFAHDNHDHVQTMPNDNMHGEMMGMKNMKHHEHMMKMHKHMDGMRQLMESIKQEDDPENFSRMMEQHMQSMRKAMHMMNENKGGMMDREGEGDDMDIKGEGKPKHAHRGMKKQMQMMQDMMMQMMEHMNMMRDRVDHENGHHD